MKLYGTLSAQEITRILLDELNTATRQVEEKDLYLIIENGTLVKAEFSFKEIPSVKMVTGKRRGRPRKDQSTITVNVSPELTDEKTTVEPVIAVSVPSVSILDPRYMKV